VVLESIIFHPIQIKFET